MTDASGRQRIVAYDPGLVTGIAEGVFSPTKPLLVLGAAIVTYEDLLDGHHFMVETEHDHVVSEVFTSRTDNEFAPDLTGVRVEGVLDLVYRDRIVWRDRTKKAQVKDSVLKSHGIWYTGKDVGWEDGRDANDAIIHMLGYVAFDLRHVPTLRKYFQPSHGKVTLR